MTRLKVIIVDDHIIFQQSLKLLLEAEDKNETSPNFEVLDCADTGKALLALLKTKHPDIIFLDLNMPNMDGVATLQEIKSKNTFSKVIVLTMYEDPKVVKKVLPYVDGYVLKKYGKNEIIQAVKEVMDNKTYFSKEIAFQSKDIHHLSNSLYDDKFVRKFRLTKRELQVLQLISEANSNKEIAKELFISDQTVSVHRKNIMKKLNVSNTAGLISVAYKYNLLQEKESS